MTSDLILPLRNHNQHMIADSNSPCAWSISVRNKKFLFLLFSPYTYLISFVDSMSRFMCFGCFFYSFQPHSVHFDQLKYDWFDRIVVTIMLIIFFKWISNRRRMTWFFLVRPRVRLLKLKRGRIKTIYDLWDKQRLRCCCELTSIICRDLTQFSTSCKVLEYSHILSR